MPPSINQFSQALDKNQATELLKVLMKYQPEDKKAKQQRLREIAAAKEAGKEPAPSKAPKVCVCVMGGLLLRFFPGSVWFWRCFFFVCLLSVGARRNCSGGVWLTLLLRGVGA